MTKTPKQYAKYLYNSFFTTTPQPFTIEHTNGLNFNTWDKEWTHAMAKNHAKICVDEILGIYSKACKDLIYPKDVAYFKEVKSEIEQLIN